MRRQDGALLIDKPAGISSFGVIEQLQNSLIAKTGLRRRALPKLGHGGTLDPFATGLLAVCTGRAVKLARYFLGSSKAYRGVIKFGETTVPGDPTAEISERSDVIPGSIEEIRKVAHSLTLQPYLQTPPMFSAKKKDGKPLYELARQGIEVEREARLCHLHSFEITSYSAPRAEFSVSCSSGTYIRTLSQDLGRLMGSVALLETLHREASGSFRNDAAWPLERINQAVAEGRDWDELPCWVPFDELLRGYGRAEATEDEANSLFQGRQGVLFNILRRTEPATGSSHGDDCVAIFQQGKLVAIARRENEIWGLERVFTPETEQQQQQQAQSLR
jgi:tRNA pseudouridine55 synthase